MPTIEIHQLLAQLARQGTELLKLQMDVRLRPNSAASQEDRDATMDRIEDEFEAIDKQREHLLAALGPNPEAK